MKSVFTAIEIEEEPSLLQFRGRDRKGSSQPSHQYANPAHQRSSFDYISRSHLEHDPQTPNWIQRRARSRPLQLSVDPIVANEKANSLTP